MVPFADRSSATTRRGFWQAVGHGDSYGLLFLLLLMVFGFAVAGADVSWFRAIGGLLSAGALLLTMYTSRARPRYFALGAAALLAMMVLVILDYITGRQVFIAWMLLLRTLLMAFCIPIIFFRLAREGEVTSETVAGALCIYVLMGLGFGGIYATAHAFSGNEVLMASSQHGAVNSGDYYYFSFTTMTTTGYGDLAAGTNWARAVAMTEAVIGQVFLATLVARLVSSATARRGGGRRVAKPAADLQGDHDIEAGNNG